MNDHYPFSLKPLPYAYDALEPYISEETLRFHHDKHLKAYVDKLNETLKPYPEFQDWSLKALIVYSDGFPKEIKTDVKNNAGGVYNHELYFDSMGPARGSVPNGSLKAAMDRSFGSYEGWKKQMKESAMSQFGSGWAWTTFDATCKFLVLNSPNQDVPAASILTPLLLVDVWEHAYYLQYQNRRAEYLENWFQVINWDAVSARYSCG